MTPSRMVLLVVSVSLMAVFSSTAQSAPQPVKEADVFVDSIGTNMHLGWYDTVYYSKWTGVRDKLVASGIRHVRDEAKHASGNATDGSDAGFYSHLRELNSYGIKANLSVGPAYAGLEYPLSAQDLADIATKAGSTLEQIEGPNEVDNTMGTDYATEVRAYQQSLYQAAKGNPSTANMPVLAASIARGCCGTTSATAIGDLSAYADKGNMHSYPGGQMPSESRLDQYYIPNAKTIAPGKTIQATETGYNNALSTTDGHLPASEKAAGKYMPRLYFEYFNRGVERFYNYEFINSFSPSTTNIEANFGLLRNDLSEKSAYTAVKNLISILSDPGPSFTPTSLDYTLSGDTTNVHQTLLQKRDGKFYLALWKEVSSWDKSTRTDINVTPSNVTLTFNQGISGGQVFQPGVSASAQQTFGAVSSVNLSVPDEVLLVEITADGSTPPPPPADITPPRVDNVSPVVSAMNVVGNTNVEVTFSESMHPSTITGSTFSLTKHGSSTPLEAAVSYDEATKKATLDPNSDLEPGATYTATVEGGDTGCTCAEDAAGNTLAQDKTWSFTVGSWADTTPPETTIASGPSGTVKSSTATFEFSSSESSSTFECSLDGASFASCTSPTPYDNLADGEHTFEVRATDAATGTYTTPVSRTWTIDTADPKTTIGSTKPANLTNSTSASFSFSSSESNSTFKCKLDSGDYEDCSSTKQYTGLTQGSHTFSVKAIDQAGNEDETPEGYTWTIDTTAPTVDSVTPTNSATSVSRTTTVTATFSEAMDSATLTPSMNPTVTLVRTSSGASVSATVSYDEKSNTVTLKPSSTLAANTKYTARVKGGTSSAKDKTGNPLASDKVWSFTTGKK